MTDKIKLQKLQLMRSIKDTDFFAAYKKLITNNYQELSENEKFLLLKFAVIFINEGEKELEKFGYRIILRYSNSFNDYKPLYDIAMAKNYIPVAKKIENKIFNANNFEESFHSLFMSAYKENFAHKRNDKTIYFSEGQKRIYNFSKENNDYIIVAPTSYGKSELIIHKVEDNLNKNICIIVPTKSLLAQTRKNLIKNSKIKESQNKIITHPDMLNTISGNIIAVLTQERLLRLIQKHTVLNFDIVLIDEAHNLIENDSREILTIQDLKILKKRNSETKFHYFTPFLVEPKKLKIFSNNDELLIDKIQEFIKVEKYYYFDLFSEDKALKIYDQFLDKSFQVNSDISINKEFEFINKYASNKNIIYLNRPKHIEEFSSNITNEIEITEEIKKVQKALKEFLHEDYNLIKTLNNGIVYHHGGMPENIRQYVENAFSKIDKIKYIITSSTLLQGVNIPAEKIFLLTTIIGKNSNLNASQFKNLSGRVCRFSEVFNKQDENLKMLEPEVYVIKSKYHSNAGSRETFLKNRVKDNKIILDEIKNPFIKENTDSLNVDDEKFLKKAKQFQENIEQGSTNLENPKLVTSEIGKLCFKNNVHDFDIFENEKTLVENLNQNKAIPPINSSNILISVIYNIFIKNINFSETESYNDKKKYDRNFERLENIQAQRFYAMFLDWRTSTTSYKIMINQFLWYWNTLDSDNKKIYVGSRWGECKFRSTDFIENYIDLNKKNNSQKVNIAILRIREEQDFVDYKLMPYVEILNDLELIKENFYNQIKYGTDDQDMIKLLKEGFSIELAKIVKNNYSDQITISDESIEVKKEIIEKMKENNENEILIFEIGYYIN